MKEELLKTFDDLICAENRLNELHKDLYAATDQLNQLEKERAAIKAPTMKKYIEEQYRPAKEPSRPTEHANYSDYSFEKFLSVECGDSFPLSNPLELIVEDGLFVGIICLAWCIAILLPIWLIKCIFKLIFIYPSKYRRCYNTFKALHQQEMAEYEKKLEQVNAENQNKIIAIVEEYKNTDWESIMSLKFAEKDRAIDYMKNKIDSLTTEEELIKKQIAQCEAVLGVSNIDPTEFSLIREMLCNDEDSSVSDIVSKARQILREQKEQQEEAKLKLFNDLCQVYCDVPIPDGGAYWNEHKEKTDFKVSVTVHGLFTFKNDLVLVQISTHEKEFKYYERKVPIPEVLQGIKLAHQFKQHFDKHIIMSKKCRERYEITKTGDFDALAFTYNPTDIYL